MGKAKRNKKSRNEYFAPSALNDTPNSTEGDKSTQPLDVLRCGYDFRMKHLVAITITVLVAFPMSATHARCYVPTPTEALAGARAVFVGKVISVTDPTFPAEGLSPKVFNLVRPVKVRFAVEHVYRGRKIREVEVRTQTGGLEWGYELKSGRGTSFTRNRLETTSADWSLKAAVARDLLTRPQKTSNC